MIDKPLRQEGEPLIKYGKRCAAARRRAMAVEALTELQEYLPEVPKSTWTKLWESASGEKIDRP